MNKLNYNKWALRFIIWIIIINIAIVYLTVNYVNFPRVENNNGMTLFFLRVLGNVLLLLSIIFITISSVKKEEKNYQYWISIAGIMLFGIIPLISILLKK